MATPLAGLRVLDITQNLAGPYCTLLLADLGADVIKVERPDGGDEIRESPPFVRGESAAFMMVNRNKRSLTLNLKHPRARAICRELAARADILVENHRPGMMRALGLDYESLRPRNPRLIYCAISGFGQYGPYRDQGGFDLITQGISGLISVTGQPGAPAKCGVPVSDLGTGMYSAFGILAAVIARDQTGEGQLVDTALLDTAVSLTVWESARYLATGDVPGPLGTSHRLGAPYEAFPTADIPITIGASKQSLWEKLCCTIGAEALLAEPRFASRALRLEHRDALAEALGAIFRPRPSAHWLELLHRAGIPAGPVNSLDRTFADPQVRARDLLVEVEHPVAGPTRLLGLPIKLSATPGQIARPAPTLGQHTGEVLAELGYDAAAVERLRQEGVI